ncbi:MAG: flagellar basal body rod protein FlgC [Lachnoclostridium sp.]|jgi:flagellar basal-body rod protein FlgC|nr:flagellar basal body rod protein FlgC [Lachnoclostridium sp.]
MSVFGSFDISSSGMTAQRTRTDLIAQNIANANSTRDADGNIYRRKTVVFEEKSYVTFEDSLITAAGTGTTTKGVKINRIVEDMSEGAKVYDPSHPDADEEGYVTYPNVNIVEEMTNMIDASRAYEANVTALNASKSMIMRALDLGKGV